MAAWAHGNIGALLKKHGCTEIKKVGEGSFGKAILVQDGQGNRLICKMVDISKASRKEMQDALAEGKLLEQLKHPYIVRYRENFTDNGWFCILMDYCEGGDLTKKIDQARKQRTTIAEDQVLRWFTQTILALKYIHDKHILHRDLKPSNLFLSQNGSMKMGDFGIAKVLDCTVANAKTQIGTPYYLSPELCQEKPYAWPSDIWAMGCILYEMCALKVPFDAPSITGLMQKIVRGHIPTAPSTYSNFVRELCGQLLNRSTEKRPGCDDILQRPQIQTVVQQIKDEAQVTNETNVISAKPSQAMPRAAPILEGPYSSTAGTYKRADSVEYNSSAHKTWLPAKVTNVDGEGSIIIDLKPNTWIPKAEQAFKVRPRAAPEEPEQEQVMPVREASPAVPRQCNTPMRQRSPSVNGRAYCASPMLQRSPSAAGRAASPSPLLQRSPSVGRPASRGAAGWGVYKKGDLIEFYSNSHKDWLPATVINVDAEGRIVIDLKPNTWVSREEQASKVRPRKGAMANARPQSRCASPMMQRSPSYGGLEAGQRAMTPSRAPSPRRAASREPPSRAESPRLRRGADAGIGTPRVRPPGIPPGMPRVSDSPLRAGGRNIAGL